jgi:hypothetical protein
MRHVILVACALLMAGCAKDILTIDTRSTHRGSPRSDRKRIAVVDFRGDGGQSVAEFLAMNLLRSGYDVVERDRIRDIVLEQQIGVDGFTKLSDVDKAESLGRVLNADVIMTGEVVTVRTPRVQEHDDDWATYSGARIELAARVFDARSGEILWLGHTNVTCQSGLARYLKLLDFIDRATKQLVESYENPNSRTVRQTLVNSEIGPAVASGKSSSGRNVLIVILFAVLLSGL